MTRTLKFRAWLGNIMHPIWSRIDEDVYITHPDIKIMQFTGLLDRNGKEIYEGDIVSEKYTNEETSGEGDADFRWEIKWDNEQGMYCDDEEETIASVLDRIEVIGNIYENEELLK